MNREKIIELLKQLEKETCSPSSCPAVSYDDCSRCYIHKIVNDILVELNGS